MVRPLLTSLALILIGGLVGAAPADERLRLLYADVLENISTDGQVVQMLTGHVKFQKGTMELTTDRAVFYRGEERTHLAGDVVMVRPGERLTCDSLVFYNDEDRFDAWGRVRFEQEDQTITCREFTYWTELDSGIGRRDVVMTQGDRRLTTDEFHYQKTDGLRGASFHAYGSVLIEEGDRRVSGQRMTYNDLTGVLDLIEDAAVKQGKRDLRGTRIQLLYEGDQLQTGFVKGGAEATAQIQARLTADHRDWRVFTDLLTSRGMQASFVDDRLATLQLQSMASSIYHVVEDSILQGVNHTTGDTLTLDFDETSKLVRIQVRGGARGRFEPEGDNTEVDTVVVYQADYIDYDIPGEVTYLERGARVDYKENGLAAGHIVVTWQNNLTRAEVAFEEQPTLYQRGHDPMYGQLMEFNLVTEMGRVVKGRTKLENGYYHGELLHRHPGNVYYVRRSLYTTCDLDTPHFYFAAQRMKMLQGDKVIARPVILYLMDVPVMGLPFLVFPNESGERRTGWIMPSYGSNNIDGRYLEGLGYFWAISDYADATTLVNLFDERGIQVRGRLRYNKRDNFSGNVNGTFFRILFGNDKNIANLFSGSDLAGNEWSGSWVHRQKIDPTQQLNVNARYTSNPKQFRKYGLDLRTRLEQRIVSSASYSKRWPGTGNRLTLGLRETYDLQAADRLIDTHPTKVGQRINEKSRTLPRLSFSHSKDALFKPRKGQPPSWYHNIYWSFASNLNNLQSVFWEADTQTVQTVRFDTLSVDSLVVDTVMVDSLIYFWPKPKDRTVENRTWAKNNMGLQAQQNLFRYITVSLNLGINQDWTPSYRKATLDSAGAFVRDEKERVIYETVDAFTPRHTGHISLSAQTTLYGLLPVRIGSLEALRHVIKPRLSYAYTPDFSKDFFGFDLGYFQRSSQGELFDRFAGSPIGGTPSRERQTLSISVSNLFQAKREVEGKEVKTTLLTWNMSTSYNFTADSLRLSPIRSSFRSPFLRKLNLDISMDHDIYEYEWDETTQRRIRVNKVRAFPRLTRMNASTRLRLAGKRFVPLVGAEPEEAEEPADTLDLDRIVEEEDQVSFSRRVIEPEVAPGNLWEATFSLRYSLTAVPEKRETFWMNGNLKLSIGPGWKVGYTARFDMLTRELVSHDLQLYRQLHCWEFSFSWTPSGFRRGFLVRINVMDADLRDIKYENRGGRQSGLYTGLF